MARPCVARRMVAMGRRLRARKRRGLEGEGGGPDKASELKAVKPLLDPLPLAGRVVTATRSRATLLVFRLLL